MARRATRWALLSCVVLAGVACSSGGSKPCGSGQVQCGGCYDPAHFQTDPYNCGGCGIACGAGATCAAGLCQCPAGQDRCDLLSPRCRDLQTDEGACGSCATTCSKPGSSCQGGACGCFGANPNDCETFCTDWTTDRQHCGTDASACTGHACQLTNEICSGGACACPPTFPTECPTGSPTACVNTTNDPANCGSCGNACLLANEICSGNTCQCPPSLPDQCSVACVKFATDAQNCGACGNACAKGAACASGTCSCPTGEAACNDTCVPCAAGAACCPSGSCQTQHSNGIGQFYFDCNPLYAPAQTTIQAATAAAHAWMPGTPTPAACDPVYCISLQTGSQCAVWCTAGSNFAGRVELDSASPVCVCPNGLSKTWN